MRAVYIDATSAYEQGYADALQAIRRRKYEKKKRNWYFIKQRVAGAAMLLLTILMVALLDGDATIGLFTVPLALYLIFGKEMVIVNGFYWETKERERKNDTDTRAIRWNR